MHVSLPTKSLIKLQSLIDLRDQKSYSHAVEIVDIREQTDFCVQTQNLDVNYRKDQRFEFLVIFKKPTNLISSRFINRWILQLEQEVGENKAKDLLLKFYYSLLYIEERGYYNHSRAGKLVRSISIRE